MSDPARLPTREDFAAAADWWRAAGLDHDFTDDATDWLTAPAAPPAAIPEPAAPKSEIRARTAVTRRPADAVENASLAEFGGAEAGWPVALDRFSEWWLQDPTVESGGTGPRIAPRGPASPALMVVVAHPEAHDRTVLLSGQEGALLNAFLRAARIGQDQVYFAALLPRFTAAPDWAALHSVGVGRLLAHHISLVDPARLLFLGENIPPLLGHDTAQEDKTLRSFNHKGRTVPYVEGRGLARLLRSAAARQELWRSWLDGTDG